MFPPPFKDESLVAAEDTIHDFKGSAVEHFPIISITSLVVKLGMWGSKGLHFLASVVLSRSPLAAAEAGDPRTKITGSRRSPTELKNPSKILSVIRDMSIRLCTARMHDKSISTSPHTHAKAGNVSA